MILNIYKAQNGEWQSVNAFYPVMFSHKINLEFDSGAFNSFELGTREIKPYTLVKIEVGDTANALDTFYFYTTPSESWRPTERNQIAWQLVEPAKELQGVFLDGITSTYIDGAQKTLLTVVQRLLRVTPLRKEGQAQKYTLTTDLAVVERLTAYAPEFRWSAQTSLWEALVDIGACINAIPRLTANGNATKFDTITFDFVNTLKPTTTDERFVGRLRSVNEEQYCSALESNAQNLVTADEEEGSLVFPAPNAFATPRTEDVKLTDQNCELILSKPIADVSKFECDATGWTMRAFTFVNTGDGTYTKQALPDVTLADVGLSTALDLTAQLVDSAEWQTLPKETVQSGAQLLERKTKDNTFFYERYSNKITLKNQAYKGATDVFAEGAWNLVVNTALNGLLKYWSDGDSNSQVNDIDISKSYTLPNGTRFWIGKTNGFFVDESETNLMKVGFRLTYKPMNNNVKLRAYKGKQGFDFVQPYNQRAEINNSLPYGQNMLTTANRLGVETQKIVDYCTSWGACKKVGDSVGGLIVTSIDYNILGKDAVECVYTLSKDWSYLSQWFGVDKKFRSWNIPANYTLRNLYYADKVKITTTQKENPTNTSCLTTEGIRFFMNTLQSVSADFTEINNVWLTNIEGARANVVNATSFGFANSITLHGEMRDNLSAGIMVQADDDMYNIDSYYANDDGTLEHANIVFGGAIANSDASKLPNAERGYNTPGDAFVEINNLLVEKDAGEQLAVTYQLIAEKDDILVVGDELFAGNLLCKTRTSAPQVKLYGLTQGFETINTNELPSGAEEINANIIVYNYNDYASVLVPQIDSKYLGWAIAIDNKVLLGGTENKGRAQFVYFYFENSRGAGVDADIEYKVSITYKLLSPQGKGNKVFVVEHIANQPFVFAEDLQGKIPEHFEQSKIRIGGLEAGTTYTPTTDTEVTVELTFVPFTADFDVGGDIVVPARNSNNGIYGYYEQPIPAVGGVEFKAGRYTFVDFPSASNGYVEYNPYGYSKEYWQAVAYVTPIGSNGAVVKPFFYLIGVAQNSGYTKAIDGRSSNSATWQALTNALYPSSQVDNSSCQYTFSLLNGKFGIEISPFGTINDYNGGLSNDNETWRYWNARFRISKISQMVETENQL